MLEESIKIDNDAVEDVNVYKSLRNELRFNIGNQTLLLRK